MTAKRKKKATTRQRSSKAGSRKPDAEREAKTDEEREARVLAAVRAGGDRNSRWCSVCVVVADVTITGIASGAITSLGSVCLDRASLRERMERIGSLSELRRSFVVLDPRRPATTSGSLLVLTPEAVAYREEDQGVPLKKMELVDVVKAVEERLLKAAAAS